MHPYFEKSFEHYACVTMDMQETFWNYLAYGMPPGSFCKSVIINDFYGAALRAHHLLDMNFMRDIARWLVNETPEDSYGSVEKYKAWIKLSDDDRRDILILYKLRPSVIDVLKGTPR